MNLGSANFLLGNRVTAKLRRTSPSGPEVVGLVLGSKEFMPFSRVPYWLIFTAKLRVQKRDEDTTYKPGFEFISVAKIKGPSQ